MGFFKMIRDKKEEFQQERHLAKAGKLSSMRTERLKQEGRAKVSRAYDQEKAKTKAAKKEQFQRSFTGKAIAGIKKAQKRLPKTKSTRSGVMQKTEINPAFSLGGSKKKKKYFYE